jgi:uncharacterized protein
MIRTTLFAFLLGLLLACRNPSPAVVFHTLTPLAPAAARAAQPPALEIMPVQLPELLQRSQLVLLDGVERHRLSTTHRWGNTLEKDLQRVLIADLGALLGSDGVVPYPQGDRLKARYRIALDVQQCDGAPGGTLRLKATWMVTATRDGRLLLLRRSSLEEPVRGGDIDDLVSAHSRVALALSQEIAAALKELPDTP